jgi:polar amino acid transport system substrate-binding protein
LRIVTLSARRAGVTVAIGALALTSAACGSSSKSGASGGGASSAASSATGAATSAASSAPGSSAPASSAASSAPSSSGASSAPASGGAITLPDNIKKAGVIKIATDASYAPVESFAKDNKTIVGFDPDLGAALGKVLGVKVVFTNTGFDGIIPALSAGRYDMAMSAMTDNTDREKTVDFVDYFSAGTSFMVKKGGPTINTLADICGHKVAVEKGTTQLDDATAQAKKCSKPNTVLPFDDQSGANLALSSGRADVVMADSPVNAYAAQQSKGAFTIVGQTYGTAPYGIAVPKKSTALRDALVGALNKMIADGSYKTLLTKWGVQAGALDKATVNGGASS